VAVTLLTEDSKVSPTGGTSERDLFQ